MTYKYNDLKQQISDGKTARTNTARQFNTSRTNKYNDDQEFFFLKQIANSYQCINQESKQKELFLNQLLNYPINFEFAADPEHNIDFHDLSHRLAYIY